MTKDTYNTIIDSMVYKDIKDNDGNIIKTIPVYRDDLPKDIHDVLFHELQMKLAEDNGCTFEQSYSVMYDALALFSEIAFEDLEAFDPFECPDIASVYYAEQLEYLTVDNMYAIADIVRDNECGDIATACAIWYETTVHDFALSIKSYILDNE